MHDPESEVVIISADGIERGVLEGNTIRVVGKQPTFGEAIRDLGFNEAVEHLDARRDRLAEAREREKENR